MNAEITHRAVEGHGCSREEARALADAEPLAALKESASRIREVFFGDEISFCVIVNARSGACSEDCRYCAQSARHSTGVETYRLMPPDAILADAGRLSDSRAETYGIVTSGPTVGAEELEQIGQTVERLRDESVFKPCASLGRLDVDQLKTLKRSGLTRFHHNLETSKRFYETICSTHSWEERVETVRAAQEAGLDVCCGGLFGLGETWEDRIDLALSLRELGIKSVPVNFLNPVAGTPMGEQPLMSADEALRLIAVYRHLLPDATIRVCGGRPVVLGDWQGEMFAAGANAIMTGDYLTTSGISPESDRALVESLGLRVKVTVEAEQS